MTLELGGARSAWFDWRTASVNRTSEDGSGCCDSELRTFRLFCRYAIENLIRKIREDRSPETNRGATESKNQRSEQLCN